MSVREIKARLAVDGEKQFTAALKDATRNMRVMDSAVKEAAAAYDLSGDKAEFLARKQNALAGEIRQQEKIVEALSGALSDSAQKYGEASSKTDSYRIKLNNANATLSKLRKELEQTDREAEEFGRDSIKVGRQIEDGIGEAAEDASRKLEDMFDAMRSDIGSIAGSTGISALKDMGDAVFGTMESISSFVEESEDYRRQLSFVEQNAIDAGYNFVTDVMPKLYTIASLTGDMDGAIESISNLLTSGFDSTELRTAIEQLGGAVIKFPETMKFENLAESLQETVATGQATGQFAELVGRLAGEEGLEKLNKALDAATTAEEKQQVALSFLNSLGLQPTYDNYVKNNEEMIKAEEASLKHKEALAKLGEALLPVQTSFTEFKTAFVLATTAMIEGGFDTWIEGLGTKLETTRESLNLWVKALIGEENYDSWFGGEREAGTPGAYAGAVTPEEIAPAKPVTPGMYAGMPQIETTSKILPSWDDVGGTTLTNDYEQGGKSAGEAAITGMTEAIDENLPLAEEAAETAGANVTTELQNSITEGGDGMIGAVQDLVEGINGWFEQIQIPDFSGLFSGVMRGLNTTTTAMGAGAGRSGSNSTSVTVNVGGRTVASVVSREQSANTNRSIMLNA